MPESGSYLPDESSLSRIDTDPERGALLGTDRGVTSGPETSSSEPGVLAMNILPPGGYVADAFARASAPGQQQLDGPNPTPPKYADELMEDLNYTVAPTPGLLDGDNAAVLTQGYDPYLTKEPKLRGNEQPATGQIQANLASTPTSGLPSTEQALMSLLFDF